MPHKAVDTPPRSVRGVRGARPRVEGLCSGRSGASSGEWQEVGRLLPLLATGPGWATHGSASRDIQPGHAAGRLLGTRGAGLAGAGRAGPRRRLGRRLVAAVAREPSRPRASGRDALEASGAPNPSVHEVCRELGQEIEAVPWTPWWQRPRTRGPPDVEACPHRVWGLPRPPHGGPWPHPPRCWTPVALRPLPSCGRSRSRAACTVTGCRAAPRADAWRRGRLDGAWRYAWCGHQSCPLRRGWPRASPPRICPCASGTIAQVSEAGLWREARLDRQQNLRRRAGVSGTLASPALGSDARAWLASFHEGAPVGSVSILIR